MEKLHDVRFPGESDEYRRARNRLLQQELELDAKIHELAKLRRELPPGGALKEDYAFEEYVGAGPKPVKLSELFAPGKDTLFLYSFMYSPSMEEPCPMCTALIDGFEGAVHHVTQRINFAVVAKSPIERIQAFAKTRGWNRVRLLSSQRNSYNRDYFGEAPDGSQNPAVNVFRKSAEGIRHFYATEMLFVEQEGDPCHADRMWAMWNILDVTPEGRGADWYPSLEY